MIYKKIWLAMLLMHPMYADLSIGQMEAMVEKIKAKRVGSNIKKSHEFISPFVTIKVDENMTVIEESKVETVIFILGGIINDKAFINEKWQKVDDMVEGYTLIEIENNSVTLVQDDRTIKVFLKQTKPIVQLNEGSK